MTGGSVTRGGVAASRRADVEGQLSGALGGRARVVSWQRSRYATSHPLDLVVIDVDGRSVRAVYKDLDPQALLPASHGTKPAFLTDHRRELLTYAQILRRHDLGTATLHAMDVQAGWLVIEHIDGVELWQVGQPGVWQDAARWLARLHDTVSARSLAHVPVIRVDEALVRIWFDRARQRCGAAVEEVADAHDEVWRALGPVPVTFLHGEAYPSNMMVRGDGRVCAIDWEMAGIGPCLFDLAALVTGWDDDARTTMIAAYRDASATLADHPLAAVRAGVRAAQIVQCLQWLGWADTWTPPPQHARDWLADARHHLAQLRR